MSKCLRCSLVLATLYSGFSYCPIAKAELPNHKLRLIIETDAGGDPDDEQSLVRFLLYTNEWEVEGIIANRPRTGPASPRAWFAPWPMTLRLFRPGEDFRTHGPLVSPLLFPRQRWK